MYDIKDRLRHASIKTTIDKYGHIIARIGIKFNVGVKKAFYGKKA